MSKLETGSRPQKMINKDMLKHLIAIGSKNTGITKMINADRNLVAHFIKFHGLIDVLSKPEDDNETTKMLREMQPFHQNSGYR